MEILSFETAKRLKDAGFPQEPADRQHWYTARGAESYIVYVDDDGDPFALLGGEIKGVANIEAGCFAPTATDILSQPEIFSYCLANDFENDAKGHAQPMFSCYDPDVSGAWHSHTNPAEAVAAAWLSQKKRKQ